MNSVELSTEQPKMNSIALPSPNERILGVVNLLELNLNEIGYVQDVLRHLAAVAELSGDENAERIADTLEAVRDLPSFVQAAEAAMQYCDEEAIILHRGDTVDTLAKKLIATPDMLQMLFVVRCVAKRGLSYAEIFDNLIHAMPINLESPTARFLFKQFADEKNEMFRCVLEQIPESCGADMYRLNTEAHEHDETVYEVITISEEEVIAEYENILSASP